MEEKTQEKQLEICPCCGKPTLEIDNVQISPEILDHFLACVITGEPFARDYFLYNGKMKVRVTSLPDETLDAMNILTSKFNFIEDQKIKDAYSLFIARLFTLLPIVSVSIKKDGQEVSKNIQAVVKPMLQQAGDHIKDLEWLTKAYTVMLDPEVCFKVPKRVMEEVVAGHLKIEKLLEMQSTSKTFFQGIVQV